MMQHNHVLELNGQALVCSEPGTGRLCQLVLNDSGWATLIGLAVNAPSSCVYLGDRSRGDDGRTVAVECQPCSEKAGKPIRLVLRECDMFGQCVPDRQVPGFACCSTCGSKQTMPVVKETIIPNDALAHSHDGTKFNCSLIDYKGKRLFAYRVGRAGSQIHVAQLTGGGLGSSTRLHLDHPMASMGREDPRLFVYDGKLHIGYIGVTGSFGPTHCLYARLSDDLQVEQIVYPKYANRQSWEKNWTWFEWAGELFAIYTISPHIVLHVVGDTAHPFQSQPWSPKWSGGALKGGASPVLIGDEYWCWFHGTVEPGGRTPNGIKQHRTYNVGVYCFQARPPFRPTRCTAHPVLWADPKTQPADFWCDCVFPCGAVLDGETWTISAGVHDSWCALYEFQHKHIERVMVKT